MVQFELLGPRITSLAGSQQMKRQDAKTPRLKGPEGEGHQLRDLYLRAPTLFAAAKLNQLGVLASLALPFWQGNMQERCDQ